MPSPCPRCRGYMHANRDMYGEYVECLHCGYTRDMPRQRSDRSPSKVAEKKVA